MEKIKYLVSGDCTVCVEFGNEISPEINRRIRAFKIALEKEAVDGVVETIPTYRSLSVVYRPEVIRFGELTKKFDAVLETMDSIQIPPPSVIEIPVLYGGDMGPDLEFVADHNHKTPEEVVRIHTSGEYLIYMLGFIAGFPYLGGMSREIAAPRLKSPRVKIDGGSVGIAGEQTGIYPVASPGGWQLIGRTPLKLYDADREKPVLLEAGQYIKFRAVDEAEYEAIEKQVETGTYQYVVFHKEVGVMGIRILNGGFLTTVQDMGRYGSQETGMAVSGVMDTRAAALADLLVGNDENEAVLEVTMMGPTMEFTEDELIAVTGGDLGAKVDGNPLPRYEAVLIKAGQTVSFGGMYGGSRAYVAFSGGLDVPVVMGSRSTNLKAKIAAGSKEESWEREMRSASGRQRPGFPTWPPESFPFRRFPPEGIRCGWSWGPRTTALQRKGSPHF